MKEEIAKYWCGSFSEVEYEFERNVLSAINTQLDNTVNKNESQLLEEVKKAFVEDVGTLASLSREALKSIGIITEYVRVNKYSRDIDCLQKWREKNR